LTTVRGVGAVADESVSAVLADASRALWVGAGERLGLAAWLDATHGLVGGKPRQVLDVAAVDSHAPDTSNEKLTVACPQMPRKPCRVVHSADEEECS